MKKSSVGEITHKINRGNQAEKADFAIDFYDKIHKYPVLTI